MVVDLAHFITSCTLVANPHGSNWPWKKEKTPPFEKERNKSISWRWLVVKLWGFVHLLWFDPNERENKMRIFDVRTLKAYRAFVNIVMDFMICVRISTEFNRIVLCFVPFFFFQVTIVFNVNCIFQNHPRAMEIRHNSRPSRIV